MLRRTTIEIDDGLLTRAKQALRCRTIRETVEKALALAAESAEDEMAARAAAQRAFLARLPEYGDMEVLASDEMWR